MTIKSPGRGALRIPYLAVRTPLGLLDEQVVVRVFGVDSTAHRSLLRGLHTLDTLAASVCPPADAATSAREPAPTPRAQTATNRADDAPEVTIGTDVEPIDRDGGGTAIEPEEQDEITQLADTFLAEDDVTPYSGELAENEELRRVQAEIRAKQEIETEHGQL